MEAIVGGVYHVGFFQQVVGLQSVNQRSDHVVHAGNVPYTIPVMFIAALHLRVGELRKIVNPR